MMGNDVWKGGGALNPNEQVGDALRSGTLGIGFIGGHNAMVALYGEGHGHSQKAWDTLYEAVMEMNKVVDEYKEKYNLNYSVLATPAEGLSGRFTKIDRRKYGKIPGVTDRDYYVNSFHVDVKEQHHRKDQVRSAFPRHYPRRAHYVCGIGRGSSEECTCHCEDRKGHARRGHRLRLHQSSGGYLPQLWIQRSNLR